MSSRHSSVRSGAPIQIHPSHPPQSAQLAANHHHEIRAYERLLKRCPRWLAIDYSLVACLDDLKFQLENEIDLAEDGGGSLTTKTRLHRIKMLLADVQIAITERDMCAPWTNCANASAMIRVNPNDFSDEQWREAFNADDRLPGENPGKIRPFRMRASDLAGIAQSCRAKAARVRGGGLGIEGNEDEWARQLEDAAIAFENCIAKKGAK